MYVDNHGQLSIYKLVHDQGYIISGHGRNLESISNNIGTESIAPKGIEMTVSLRSSTNHNGALEITPPPTVFNSCREDGEKETVCHSQCLRIKKSTIDTDFWKQETVERDMDQMTHTLHPKCLACRNCTMCVLDTLGRNYLEAKPIQNIQENCIKTEDTNNGKKVIKIKYLWDPEKLKQVCRSSLQAEQRLKSLEIKLQKLEKF